MVEILFRGKGTSGYCAGEWVYGYYCYDFWGKKDHGILPVDKNCGGYCEVAPETVGQYTGLTDKNGKKIFEGDIMPLWECGERYLYKVIYNGDCFMLAMLDSEQGSYPLSTKHKISEVVGNIHDDSELLGGADNG